MNLLDNLNNAQCQAVTSTSPVILCLAGAGSGKTTVLTRRIANLQLNHRVGTSNMLALTFTRLAGKEMKERVISLIGEELGKKLFCNTFHAFAAGVLRAWGHEVGIDKNFTIYDQEDRESVITQICVTFGSKAKPKKVCNIFEYNKVATREEKRVIDEYRYRLCQNNAVDISDMIPAVCRLWSENPDILEQFKACYTHVFVDEFQDTSDDQMKLLQLLDPRHLFVVGDDAQAIYGWRNAKVEYILNFPQQFPGCDVIKLEDNYRSTESIVHAANTLIKHNVNQTEKKLIAHKSGAEIYKFSADSPNREGIMIARMAAQMMDNGTKPSDIAVLARTNQQVTNIMMWLGQAQIPCQVVTGGDDPFKSFTVKPIFDWLNILFNRKDNVGLKKCLQRYVKSNNDLQMKEIEYYAMMKNLTLFETLQQYRSDEGHIAGPFMRFIELLEQDIQSGEAYRPSDCFNIIDKHLGISAANKSTGLTARLSDAERALEIIKMWERSKEKMGEDHSVQSFLKWLRYRDVQEKLMESKDAVKLMTVHASKGLEFDTVFIAGMVQDIFPSKRSADIEEERRLFYVAITRAKNRLFISHPEVVPDWHGNPMKAFPSQFLAEMRGGTVEQLLPA